MAASPLFYVPTADQPMNGADGAERARWGHRGSTHLGQVLVFVSAHILPPLVIQEGVGGGERALWLLLLWKGKQIIYLILFSHIKEISSRSDGFSRGVLVKLYLPITTNSTQTKSLIGLRSHRRWAWAEDTKASERPEYDPRWGARPETRFKGRVRSFQYMWFWIQEKT